MCICRLQRLKVSKYPSKEYGQQARGREDDIWGEGEAQSDISGMYVS